MPVVRVVQAITQAPPILAEAGGEGERSWTQVRLLSKIRFSFKAVPVVIVAFFQAMVVTAAVAAPVAAEVPAAAAEAEEPCSPPTI